MAKKVNTKGWMKPKYFSKVVGSPMSHTGDIPKPKKKKRRKIKHNREMIAKSPL